MRDHPDDPAHVAVYADCQLRAGALGAWDVDLDRVWAGVAAEVWSTPVGPLERLAGRILGSPGLARALVTTPALVLSWVVASALVLAVGVLATWGTGTPWVTLLAPALAGIGLAYAYGPGIDPAFELAQTLAVSDRLVLLTRALAVFGLNAGLGLVATLLTANAVATGLTLGWLLPMALVAALALAAATLARSANVGVAAGLLIWLAIVLARANDGGGLAAALAQPVPPLPYLLGTLLALGATFWATSGQRERGLLWRQN